jgi:Ran GTPase-activating protein (RanGAP) involved in mRNA processing and transport
LSSNPFGIPGINALGRQLKPHIKHLIIDDQLASGARQPVRLTDVPPHISNAGLTREVLLTGNRPIDCSALQMGPAEVNMLLGYIRVNPGIGEVTVSKCPLPLAMLSGLQKTKEVKISNAKLNPGDAMIVGAMLKYNGTIQELKLDYNNIGTAGATALADGIKECKSLTKLVLNNNSLGNAGAAAILEALKGSKMKELWLSFSGIDDEGMKTLAPLLPGLPNLADLRLGANKLGEDGASALADVLKDCKALTDLWLGGNKLGTNGKNVLNEKKPESLTLHF